MDYRDDVNCERNELKEDELICDKCNGTGCIPSKINPNEIASMCSKCQGTGKVDWIENIMGKAPTYFAGTSGTFIPTQKAVVEYVEGKRQWI